MLKHLEGGVAGLNDLGTDPMCEQFLSFAHGLRACFETSSALVSSEIAVPPLQSFKVIPARP